MTNVPVLMYHKIGVAPLRTSVPGHYVHPQRLAAQCRVLRRLGFESVSLEQAHRGLVQGGLPPRPVVFTFDDGYKDFANGASQILKSFGMTGSVFIVTNEIGGTNSWDVRLGDTAEPLMSAEEIRTADTDGHEIGSHTQSHPRLTSLSDDEARRELAGSKQEIEQLTHKECAVLCYPYGDHDDRIVNLTREAGYALACTVKKGKNRCETDPFRWKRINVRKDTNSALLLWKMMARRERREG